SGVFQIVLALGIAAEIVRRAVTGSNPESLPMFLVSIVALAVNIWCLRLISKEKEGEVHMRASYIFSKNDVIANAGVILSSILIHFTGSRWPDLVIGAFITAVVLRGGVQILTAASRESRD
ncbi:MAG: cation transporter, partial [Verrucomicrobiae bacterium]|nr:cation transporter [Verrucomicrobiae bacterium]